MLHLLSVWPSVIERFRRASRILLLLDYDGTLTPVVPRPEQAVLSSDTRHLLADLKANTRFVLGVISGRSLADVRERVGIKDIIYAGNHGLEMEGPRQQFLHPATMAQREALDSICRQLGGELGQYPGVIVENKGLTLSVHYRLAPDDLIGQVENVFNRVVAPGVSGSVIKITHGKKVFEVRPNVDWDKGKAVSRIMEVQFDGSPDEGVSAGGTLAAYFGDDLTDEAGFSVVQDAGGIAVFVGLAGQPTGAHYRVDSPAEVAESLRLLLQLG
jgi:trehalose-phosphatase